MNNRYTKIKRDFTIKNGEVKDLAIRFTGDLNEFIADYFNNPLNSAMHKAILHVLDGIIKAPVNIKDTKD